MPKQKKQKSLTLSEFLAKYETKSLQGALVTLQDSFAWDLLKSYLKIKQREFEVAALDLACQDGNALRAAKASGIACGFEEVTEKVIDEFRNQLLGNTGVIETPIPEEETV